MRKTLIAAALAVLIPGAAGAADLKGAPTNVDILGAPIKADSLTGIYFGLVGGADFVNTEISGNDGESSAAFRGIGSNGWFGELQGGYDHQYGQLVVGVFGGIGLSNADTVVEFNGAEVAKLSKDWSWLAGVRFGYAVSNHTLVYLGGGYTQANGYLEIEGVNVGDDTLHGYLVETGIETRIPGSRNVFAKVAGRYTGYASETYDGIEIDPNELKAMAGITVKLGGR